MSLRVALFSFFFVGSVIAGCASSSGEPTGSDDEELRGSTCGHLHCRAGTHGCHCACGNAECIPMGAMCTAICTPK
jgi:hypothetical protein